MEGVWTLQSLAERVEGRVIGDAALLVEGVASPSKARRGEIVCLWNAFDTASGQKTDSPEPSPETVNSSEGVLFLAAPEFFARHADASGVAVEHPKKVFPLVLALFSRALRSGAQCGIHPTAVVSPKASVAPSAWIGPLCIIEEGAVIEERAFLHGRVFIGRDCCVGAETTVEPGAVLFESVRTGRRCLIHSNAVLGCDGFGITPSEGKAMPEKIPQIGGVVLGDDVELGVCSTVDRGTLDDTVIANGTKVDNHVHIAHNVRIGRNCILVAMTGIAGSAVLEDNVIMAAGSGVKEHTRIGKGATVAAKGGAIKDVPPGEVVSGFPARPHRENFRVQAALQRLPETLSRVKKLEKRLDALLPDGSGGSGAGE